MTGVKVSEILETSLHTKVHGSTGSRSYQSGEISIPLFCTRLAGKEEFRMRDNEFV